VRCKSAVFCQTGVIIGLILHRNRKRRFSEVFQKAGENREKIGARIGLILLILSIGDKKWV